MCRLYIVLYTLLLLISKNALLLWQSIFYRYQGLVLHLRNQFNQICNVFEYIIFLAYISMKERFVENGIEYVRKDNYYLPNLAVPENKYEIGKIW